MRSGRRTRARVTTWRESDDDDDDGVMLCGGVRPYPKEPQTQIAGDAHVGNQEKITWLGKWSESGFGALGGVISIPGVVQDSAGHSLG